ncbi:MAG: TIGR01440 family protein [Bacillota bacterium]
MIGRDGGEIAGDVRGAAGELLAATNPRPGDVFVLGLSTSEVLGEDIGSSGDSRVAAAVLDPLIEILDESGIRLAVQCCEHLNRCLVVERRVAMDRNLDRVTVLPRPEAGGAAAAYAFEFLREPVVVESIAGELGMDVGDTFIGMHLRSVVVPVRSRYREIGRAHLTMAGTRPPLIGGARAVYPS